MHCVDKNRLYVRIQTEYLDENRFSCDIFLFDKAGDNEVWFCN